MKNPWLSVRFLPIGEPWKHLASWDIFQVAIPNSRYFEKLWLIPNWLLWIVIALPWHLRLRFCFQKTQSIDLCTARFLGWTIVCCPLLLIKFGISKNPPKNTRSHRIFGRLEKDCMFSWYSQHMSEVSKHAMFLHMNISCQFIRFMLQKSQTNNLEMSTKTLVVIMLVFNYQPPSTGFRWSRISFSKNLNFCFTPVSRGRVFRRKLQPSHAPPIFVWPWRRSCSSSRAPKRTYRRNSRKGPRKCQTMFFQMDGKWWFFKPTIFSMVKMWKKSSNCKLQEAFFN